VTPERHGGEVEQHLRTTAQHFFKIKCSWFGRTDERELRWASAEVPVDEDIFPRRKVESVASRTGQREAAGWRPAPPPASAGLV